MSVITAQLIKVVHTDGGREAAGYAIGTDAGDCVVRARPRRHPQGRLSAEMGGKRSITIAMDRPYVALSRHLCAVIDRTVYDNHDPSRGGTRCVYGYWSGPNADR